MGAKAVTFLVLFLAAFLFIASEVAARDLAENTDATVATDTSGETDQYGGGYGGRGGYGRGGYGGGRYGGGYGRGGYGRGGYGRGGGGYGRGRGGYGGGCRYGSCGYRCCSYAGEMPEDEPQN